MDQRPEQLPEGRLITEALRDSGMSIREASRRAGISYGRWRQIATSVQNVSPGSYGRVVAPAETLARMALVVSVTPEQLEDVGRPDAAVELRRLALKQNRDRERHDDRPPDCRFPGDPEMDEVAAAIWDAGVDEKGEVLDRGVRIGMIRLAYRRLRQSGRGEVRFQRAAG